LAHFGPHAMSELSPLLGEQRTTFARCELFRIWPQDGVIGRPSLWIAEDFGVLRFRLMVKRGPLL
jgi:hypothetical protein